LHAMVPQQETELIQEKALTVSRIGHFRWVICALLFFAAVINYVDRQVLSILAPDLQHSIGWSEIDYSNIVFAFQVAYACMFLVTGRLIDRIGTRLGFSLAIIWWSLAAMGHAVANSAAAFGFWRFMLGIGEAAGFPASIKAIAEWFPKRERALATGLFNSGTNIGAIIAPVAVPLIAARWGWQMAFIATGALGFFWLILWLNLYRRPEEHKQLSKPEFSYIRSDPAEPRHTISWFPLLRLRQTWAFALGKFLTDPVWWFYLFWLPKFLNSVHGVKTADMISYLLAVYIVADIGSIAGGWLSSILLKLGWSVNLARKATMLLCALCVVPVMAASQTGSLWLSVSLVSLAAGAHQGWSANLFTLSSDLFPRHAIGSVVGIGGFFGSLGGMLIAKLAGYILEWYGTYTPMFVIASIAYISALGVIHLLAPKLKPS
jgi:ACS family hexuronate transporter-like MFS transporter